MKQISFFERQRDRIFSLLLSFLLMTIGSMTSPLFPLHTWVDQNCFLSVAKMWLAGKIPYRDVFEQKGPLLYLLHIPAAAFPALRFFGVYLIQIALWYAIFRAAAKISDLYLPHHKRLLTASLSALITVCSYCYSRGDNAEEFCLLPVMLSLYALLKAVREKPFPMKMRDFLIHGLFAGTVLWIKFSMLGFYIGWCLCAGILLWRDRNFLAALRAGCCFLGGMLLTALPWILYFGCNNALDDLVNVYFFSNATLYPRKISFTQFILNFFAKDIGWNPILMLPLLGGVIVYALKSSNLREKLVALVPLCTLYLFVFIGGVRYRYYLLILAAFLPFAIAHLLLVLPQRFQKLTRAKYGLLWIASLLLFGNCAYYLVKPWNSYPQVQFSAIIPENSVLLNYGFLDGGFALMSGADFPQGRYFCKVNIARDMLPEMYEAQEQTILNREADFVVIRWEPKKESIWDKYNFAPFFEYYEEIATAEETHDHYCYALYQLK